MGLVMILSVFSQYVRDVSVLWVFSSVLLLEGCLRVASG